MYAFELSLQYRRAVKERDFETILSLFANDAKVVSPLKGTCDPKTYHEWIFAAVKNATVEVQNVFQALNGDISIAVQSHYRWLLNNEKVIEFGGMSVFEFTPDRKKIRRISNFYDTSVVRSALLEANGVPLAECAQERELA
jgi:hypothetical protein